MQTHPIHPSIHPTYNRFWDLLQRCAELEIGLLAIFRLVILGLLLLQHAKKKPPTHSSNEWSEKKYEFLSVVVFYTFTSAFQSPPINPSSGHFSEFSLFEKRFYKKNALRGLSVEFAPVTLEQPFYNLQTKSEITDDFRCQKELRGSFIFYV